MLDHNCGYHELDTIKACFETLFDSRDEAQSVLDSLYHTSRKIESKATTPNFEELEGVLEVVAVKLILEKEQWNG